MRGKRLAAALLVLAALLPILSGSSRAESDVSGDLNGDWTVTSADAAVLLRRLAGLIPQTEAEAHRADITQSGAADETDVRVILHAAAGLIPNLVTFVERISTGLCDERLFDRFSYTGTRAGDGFYQSENVRVTLTETRESGLAYYIADIYIQDVTSFRTALSSGVYRGKTQTTEEMARDNGAIIAINGEYYSARDRGPIIRDGVVYKSKVTTYADLCLIYRDGTMGTYRAGSMHTNEVADAAPWQSWVFGPRLLDDAGNAMRRFNSTVPDANPRTAIGYYEPGHYCFVVVDGRQGSYSHGMTLRDLSALFYELGCTAAYNLDGGETSVMATAERTVNRPFNGGRNVSDIVYIAEPMA